MAVKVTLEDAGLRDLQARLKELGRYVITIGFQGPSGAQLYPLGLNAKGPAINMATLATYQEFGTKSIPARAFLRSAVFWNREEVETIMAGAAKRVVTDGLGPIAAFSEAGPKLVKIVERVIRRSKSWAKGNAPSTIANKGFDYPLHETGLLEDSVSWAVRLGSARGSIINQGGSE